MSDSLRAGRTTRTARLVVLLLSTLLPAACLLEPREETSGIVLSLPGDAASGSAATAWDQQDRLHLDAFSKFVRLALSRPGEDYEQVAAVWPPRSGAAVEGVDGQVALDLQVAPGLYRVTVLGYAIENERVFAFQQRSDAPLSLVAGKSTDAEIFTRLHPSGTLDVSLRCQNDDYLPFVSAQLSLVDARARVVLPPSDVPGSPPSFSPVLWDGIPINRPFQARVLLTNQLDHKVAVLEIYAPVFSVENTGEHRAVSLTIPCAVGE